MHGQQERDRILRGLGWGARARPFPGLARESVQLLLAARIAEYDVVPGTREDRAEFPAHQSRTENADSHLRDPSVSRGELSTLEVGKKDGHREPDQATGKAKDDERYEWECEHACRDAHDIERREPRRRAQEYQAAANLALLAISRRCLLDPTLHPFARNQPHTPAGIVHPDLAEHLTGGRRDDQGPTEFRWCDQRSCDEIRLGVQQWNHRAAHAEGERPEHDEKMIHGCPIK